MATKVTRHNEDINIADAEILFRNFSGKESKFNKEGNRNFCVLIPVEAAQMLIDDGWNIKFLAPRNDDEVSRPYMQVSVSYRAYPPRIYVITSNNKRLFEEQDLNELDWADISTVDLVIRPYNWEVNGNHGKKAYVKVMYVTLFEDEFASKYEDTDIPF